MRQLIQQGIQQIILEEIKRIRQSLLEVRTAVYNSHKVQARGEEYWAYDTKAVNKELNQRRRGEYRYLLNKDEVKLAKHKTNGTYIILEKIV